MAACATARAGANGLNDKIKALLDDALVAAELAKAEEAAARNGSRLEREAARVLRERAQLLEKSARLESKALQSQWHQARLSRDEANNLTGENMEATYSLVSSAVELLELRQQLAAAEMRQESAEDDLMEMHTNYEILTNQLLVEQEAKRHVEAEAAHLRAQLTAASQVLAASAGEIEELKGQLMFMQGSICDANAEVSRLRGCLSAAEAQTLNVQSAAAARQTELEATISRLTAELASSREAAEGLRRDLRAAQADGEGRDRQHDASTRDLRKELRDCDETIGALRQQLRAAEAAAKPMSSSGQEVAHLAIIAELRAQLAARDADLAGPSRYAPAVYSAPATAPQPLAPPPVVAAAAPAPQQAAPAPRAAPKPRAKKPQAEAAAPAPKKAKPAPPPVAVAAAEDVDVAPAEELPEAPPAPVAPSPQPASVAAPQPDAAPRVATVVDISVPYSPPDDGDSDSEFEPPAAEAKRAKSKPANPKAAPKAKAPEVAEVAAVPMPPAAAAAPEPAPAVPAPPRAALAPLVSNLPPAPAAASSKPRAPAPPGGVKKRKLLDVSTAVDTMPPAFLFGMMGGGGFTAPKLKPAF